MEDYGGVRGASAEVRELPHPCIRGVASCDVGEDDVVGVRAGFAEGFHGLLCVPGADHLRAQGAEDLFLVHAELGVIVHPEDAGVADQVGNLPRPSDRREVRGACLGGLGHSRGEQLGLGLLQFQSLRGMSG